MFNFFIKLRYYLIKYNLPVKADPMLRVIVRFRTDFAHVNCTGRHFTSAFAGMSARIERD